MNARTSEVIVASYNVHGCVGTDGVLDTDRVAAGISELNADVVGLQEVDCRLRDADGADQLARLAAATGFHAVPGPRVPGQKGYYGNAILTRHPVVDVVHTSLNYPRREPRGMIDVILRVATVTVRVVVTHFGLRSRERRHQADLVLNILRREDDPAAPRPFDVLVLLGDFNEWHPVSMTLLRLHEAFGRTPAVRTFPSRFPLFALDRVWVRPRALLNRLTASRTPTTRIASDHLPVRAVLDLAKGGLACPTA